MSPGTARLRTRLTLTGLLAVAPALIAIIYLQSIERNRAREKTLVEVRRTVHLAATSEATVFDGARRLLLTLSEFPALRSSDASACTTLLAGVLHSQPRYVNFIVADTSGTIRCSALNRGTGTHRQVADQEWFQRVLKGEVTAVSTLQFSAASESRTILVAHQIADSAGRIVRVVAACITLDRLAQIVSPADLLPGATLTVFDRTGTILARSPDNDRWVGKHVPLPIAETARLAAGGANELTETAGIDGVRRIYMTVPVPTAFPAAIYVGLGVDPAVASAEGNRILRQYLWLLALVLLGAVCAALLGGQTLVLRPVRALKGVADRLAAGDLSARAQLAASVASVGDLADAVNAMAEALDTRERERDAAQDDVRATRDRYRLLFEENPNPMWAFERGTLRFLEVNDAAVRRYGYSHDEFLSMTLLDIRPEDDRNDLLDHLANESERSVATTWRHRLKSGEVIDVEIRSHRLQFEGHDSTLVAVNDISDRRRAERALRETEEQLRQSQKMEAVGQLAGGIAHDFNNLLMVIGTNTEFVGEALPENSPAQQDLAQVRTAANRAAQLTRQLLAFSRKQVLRSEPVDVDQLVERLVPMLRRLIGEDIHVETALSGTRPMTVADQSQVEQAILNLAINARDAMPNGGLLRITTGAKTLDAGSIARAHLELTPGPYVLITVTDTGCGMNPQVMKRVFEPFFTTKTVGKGTGLGLSSVYGTVKQSGGDITVESIEGTGTSFTIYLPTLSDTPECERAQPIPASNHGDEIATILLVEDDPAVRAAALRILTSAGHEVIVADGGESAIAAARRHGAEIDIVLSDVVMPGISVRSMIVDLVAQCPSVAIVLMSGYPTGEISRRGVAERDFTLLTKPFTAETLLTHIRETMRSRRRASVRPRGPRNEEPAALV